MLFSCPHCGSRQTPRVEKWLTVKGSLVLAGLIVLCLPLLTPAILGVIVTVTTEAQDPRLAEFGIRPPLSAPWFIALSLTSLIFLFLPLLGPLVFMKEPYWFCPNCDKRVR